LQLRVDGYRNPQTLSYVVPLSLLTSNTNPHLPSKPSKVRVRESTFFLFLQTQLGVFDVPFSVHFFYRNQPEKEDGCSL
jgi:hypothetical protein